MQSNERWSFIPGTDNQYLISTKGRVLSLSKEPMLVTPHKLCSGYVDVGIHGKRCSIHRLVAQTFIPNPNNYPVVNHINEKKDDNRIENLEWCSYSKNNSYGEAHESRKRTKGAKVRCYSLNGDFVGEFYSMVEAGKQLGCSFSGIANAVRNKDGKFRDLYFVKMKEANQHE